ncbi:hypothetical protein ACPEIF_11750 [Streptomyces sp. NPDC012600]|uniref:hypothetical protein n=1 Tax=Streptomyces sp. NPDC012600 TaxID=3415005 RepID=UPI003C2BD9DE
MGAEYLKPPTAEIPGRLVSSTPSGSALPAPYRRAAPPRPGPARPEGLAADGARAVRDASAAHTDVLAQEFVGKVSTE